MRMRQFVIAAIIATASLAAARRTRWSITSTTCPPRPKGLRNIRNHLDTEPTTKITVVTHASVDFLMEGEGRQRRAFAGPVAALVARGVKFESARSR